VSSLKTGARAAALTAVAGGAAVAMALGVAGAMSARPAATTADGYGGGCPGDPGYGYGYSSASPSGTATSGGVLPSVIPTIVPTSALPSIVPTSALPSIVPTSALPSIVPTSALPSIVPTSALPSIVPTATIPTLGSAAIGGQRPAATASAAPTCPPTSSSSTATGTATATAPPTSARPTLPGPAVGLSLVNSKTFISLGQLSTFTGTLTRGGVPAAGQQVQLFERYADGKIVSLGLTTTGPDGSYLLTVRPLYVGDVTAVGLGVTSNTVPSRVTVTYRSAKASRDRKGHLVVKAETRPGFITSSTRQERVQILLVDARGRQIKQLAIVNAAQRRFFAGEAQGTNGISYTSSYVLRRGSYRVVVKVVGTPVNTGASSRASTVTVR